MALASIKVFLHIRAASDDDVTKHEAKQAIRKLSASLTLSLADADVVVFHNGSLNVLQNALGQGKPVVSPEWLAACRTAGRRVDYNGFALDKRGRRIASAPPSATANVAPTNKKASQEDEPYLSTSSSFLAVGDAPVVRPSPPRRHPAEAKCGDEMPRQQRLQGEQDRPPTGSAATVVTRKRGRPNAIRDDLPDASLPPPVLAFTGLAHEDREVLRDVAVALGATVVEDVLDRAGDKPTHLVAAGDTLRPKVLLALCLGIPILTPEWVHASLSNGAWQPLRDEYFAAAFQDRASYTRRVEMIEPRDPRMLPDRPARGPRILHGHVLFLDGVSPEENRLFHRLVELVDGEVVRTPLARSLSAVVQMSDQGVCGGRRRRGSTNDAVTGVSVPRVTRAWLVDSILACAALPLERYYVSKDTTVATSGNEQQKDDAAGKKKSGPRHPLETPPPLGDSSPVRFRLSEAALRKTSPGPSSAVKSPQRQWNTQQLQERVLELSDSDTSSLSTAES